MQGAEVEGDGSVLFVHDQPRKPKATTQMRRYAKVSVRAKVTIFPYFPLALPAPGQNRHPPSLLTPEVSGVRTARSFSVRTPLPPRSVPRHFLGTYGVVAPFPRQKRAEDECAECDEGRKAVSLLPDKKQDKIATNFSMPGEGRFNTNGRKK